MGNRHHKVGDFLKYYWTTKVVADQTVNFCFGNLHDEGHPDLMHLSLIELDTSRTYFKTFLLCVQMLITIRGPSFVRPFCYRHGDSFSISVTDALAIHVFPILYWISLINRTNQAWLKAIESIYFCVSHSQLVIWHYGYDSSLKISSLRNFCFWKERPSLIV